MPLTPLLARVLHARLAQPHKMVQPPRMELVQIVPALPPAFSGVGDFAMLLARELLARHGVSGRFVVGDPAWNAPAAVAPFPAAAVAARSTAALRASLDALPRAPDDAVLLHYVGYGYANRGCPFWLVEALERWKRAAAPASRLLVLFHETFASGPVWSSAFWTRPFQRSLAARLARLADARRITTTVGRGELSGTFRRGETLPATVAPVFSNVGEPAAPPPPVAREQQVVVFGSRPVRAAVYANAGALVAFCARHGIGRVVDVGQTLPGGVRLDGLDVREAGPLPAPEASALFARSLAGYFDYPAPYLGKSSIFAAYCAHGMVPVTFPGNRDPAEGLRAGEHYLAGADDPAPFATVASAAHVWYNAHRLEMHARDIHQLMQV